jgi:hypothetical protein
VPAVGRTVLLFPVEGESFPDISNPMGGDAYHPGVDEFFGILYHISAEQECATTVFGRSPGSIRSCCYIPSVKPLFTITLTSTRRLRARP